MTAQRNPVVIPADRGWRFRPVAGSERVATVIAWVSDISIDDDADSTDPRSWNSGCLALVTEFDGSVWGPVYYALYDEAGGQNHELYRV